MPLDLHVLGLPLAFILSQDQTLHRIIFNNIATILLIKSSTLKKKSQKISLSLVSLLINTLSNANLRCQFQYLNELFSIFLASLTRVL